MPKAVLGPLNKIPMDVCKVRYAVDVEISTSDCYRSLSCLKLCCLHAFGTPLRDFLNCSALRDFMKGRAQREVIHELFVFLKLYTVCMYDIHIYIYAQHL